MNPSKVQGAQQRSDRHSLPLLMDCFTIDSKTWHGRNSSTSRRRHSTNFHCCSITLRTIMLYTLRRFTDSKGMRPFWPSVSAWKFSVRLQRRIICTIVLRIIPCHQCTATWQRRALPMPLRELIRRLRDGSSPMNACCTHWVVVSLLVNRRHCRSTGTRRRYRRILLLSTVTNWTMRDTMGYLLVLLIFTCTNQTPNKSCRSTGTTTNTMVITSNRSTEKTASCWTVRTRADTSHFLRRPTVCHLIPSPNPCPSRNGPNEKRIKMSPSAP